MSQIAIDGLDRARLDAFLHERLPGHRLIDVRPLAADSARAGGATTKGGGYGKPVRLSVVSEKSGRRRDLVLHFAAANAFGHDRRADRADEMLLAFDTFGQIPHHVHALDVGVVAPDGQLRSLSGAGEFWLLTDWAPGRLYADELRRIAETRGATPEDRARAEALARVVAEIHTPVGADPVAYTRAVRDLIGHGEGLFGLVDGFPTDVPGAPPSRLHAIERLCLEWRWKLKPRTHRLRRTHGDFHPFNVVIGEHGEIQLLDASRGGRGDPADDVVAMSINYLFFALEAPGSWPSGFAPLWSTFWSTYLGETGDDELLVAVAPFLAWRALVLANPRWYPAVGVATREALLGFVEKVLRAPSFDPAWAETLFR